MSAPPNNAAKIARPEAGFLIANRPAKVAANAAPKTTPKLETETPSANTVLELPIIG